MEGQDAQERDTASGIARRNYMSISGGIYIIDQICDHAASIHDRYVHMFYAQTVDPDNPWIALRKR